MMYLHGNNWSLLCETYQMVGVSGLDYAKQFINSHLKNNQTLKSPCHLHYFGKIYSLFFIKNFKIPLNQYVHKAKKFYQAPPRTLDHKKTSQLVAFDVIIYGGGMC